jgi:protein-disulfide isomerase
MNRALRTNLIAIGALLILAGIAFVLFSRPWAQTATSDITVVAQNSHRLDTAPAGTVTFTEFLDFECEVCAAVYPYVEELREEYAGEVTFVTRYFPLPGHKNSMNAAIAVEAAAQQGQFEAMYHRMFQTQAEWGEQQESKADVFRAYAEALGLNMDEYDTAVADPATEARVQQDFDDGRALDVQGTPTIFLNDQQIELTSPNDLRDAVERAVNG